MSTRRTFVKGLLAAGAGFGLSGLGFNAASAESSYSKSLPWYLQRMAQTRAASPDELTSLSALARQSAMDAGYSAEVVNRAQAQGTISISPRATKVGKCSLILDESSVFIMTHEFGTGHLERQAVQTLWTDGATLARDVVPAAHAKALATNSVTESAMAAATSCCTPTGAALGTCCQYDLQAMFECCGPCAFTLPNPVVFLACVAIWCNYCNAAHCKQWYRVC